MQATHFGFFLQRGCRVCCMWGNNMEGQQRLGGQSYRHGQEELHVQPFNVTNVLFLAVMS